MYSIPGRVGLRAARPMAMRTAARRWEHSQHSATVSERGQSRGALQQGAKRDPELYVSMHACGWDCRANEGVCRSSSPS
jgi:hypothetical protein